MTQPSDNDGVASPSEKTVANAVVPEPTRRLAPQSATSSAAGSPRGDAAADPASALPNVWDDEEAGAAHPDTDPQIVAEPGAARASTGFGDLPTGDLPMHGGGDLAALGPAFPEEAALAQGGDGGEPDTARAGFGQDDAPPGAPSSSANQSLDQLVGVIAQSASLRVGGVRQEGTASSTAPSPIDEAWASLDEERQPAWRHLTGESKVERHAKAAAPEYSRRNTNVFHLGSQVPREDGARLVCVGGADEGAEFALGRELVIGRAPTCQISLKEPSVSREHARIFREGDAYTVVDKKSGNGTFVNGERTGRRQLISGDELAFGKARFRFIEIGDVFKPVDDRGQPVLPGAASKQAQPYLVPVLVSALIVLFTVVTVLSVVYVRRSRAPDQGAAVQYLAGGLEAMKNRDWTAAQAQLEIYATLQPADPRTPGLLAGIETERATERQLDAARAALAKGDLEQAHAQAMALAATAYKEESAEIVRGIDAELDARVMRAKSALDAGQTGEAEGLLAAPLVIRAGRPEIVALAQRLREGVAKPEAPSPAAASAGERARSTEDKRPAVIAEHAAQAPAAVEQAVATFARGDLEGALREAGGAGANRDAQVLVAKLEKFKQLYDEASAEHRQKRADAAIEKLELAKAYEAKITGTRASKMRSELNRKLADMHYVKGIDASLRERFSEAYAELLAALQVDATHAAARRKVDDLVANAGDFFSEAEQLRASEPERARVRYRLVMQVLPASDERHRKARQRLDAMP